MKTIYYCVFFLLIGTGCARQPSLSDKSPFNVISTLNDSTWYGAGELLRFKELTQRADDGRQLNLLVYTDIDYPGMGNEPNPNTTTGCVNGECTRTQILMIYNIPFNCYSQGLSLLINTLKPLPKQIYTAVFRVKENLFSDDYS